jgi:transketolase
LGAKFKAFGWEAILIADGNDVSQVQKAFEERIKIKKGVPVVLIAKTVKGKGVSFLENKPNWHGKALDKTLLAKALKEIGQPQKEIRVELATPLSTDGDLGEVSRKLEKLIGPQPKAKTKELEVPKTELKCDYKLNELKATRKAYGEALLQLVESDDRVIVLDAGMDNSTFSELVKEKYPDRFLQMYIAEQTMVGVALGLSRRGWRPYLSTFAAFLTRAHDQIRMSRYSEGNLKIMGSHAGVSMGADGSSQMGLEDIAMFRSVPEAVILYPADAVAMHKLVGVADKHKGMVYLRASRPEVPVIYKNTEKFVIGGSKALKQSPKDMVTIVAAGITLHEALKAYEELKKQRITVRVIDLYSVKPLDVETLKAALFETQAIITVEDHYKEGGLGEAVAAALADSRGKVYSLAVTKLPQSGTPAELLDYEEISAQAIVEKVKKVIFG